MELGIQNLKEYFKKITKGVYSPSENEDILKNILRCAAKAIEQFNKHAIHDDIKSRNFVITDENDLNSIKLIDFNLSKLIDQNTTTVFTADIRGFCFMIRSLIGNSFNHNQNGIFERIYNGRKDISSMTAIIKFLDGECDGFNYERGYLNEDRIWCEYLNDN
uniref:Protein kinase domain-containing protein n=1 Tax=Meloidogyne hapla TaxID=6305 RepID=A0A1I8BXA3_MELHA